MTPARLTLLHAICPTMFWKGAVLTGVPNPKGKIIAYEIGDGHTIIKKIVVDNARRAGLIDDNLKITTKGILALQDEISLSTRPESTAVSCTEDDVRRVRRGG